MVDLTVLDASCYVCGHLISGPTTIYTDKGQAHPSCVNCSPYAEARITELEAEVERQSSDIAEFMDRLGPRWFLEQNWFPPSVDARRAREQGGE